MVKNSSPGVDPTEPVYARSDTLYPQADRTLQRTEVLIVIAALVAIALRHGISSNTTATGIELPIVIISCMILLTIALSLRYCWSRVRTSFLAEERVDFIVSGIWLVLSLATLAILPVLSIGGEGNYSPMRQITNITELALLLKSGLTAIIAIRRIASRGFNPALVLVASFLVLIVIGTLLLMLPRSRAPGADLVAGGHTRFQAALFTATSASCVTGLVVVPTAEYWSRFGQSIILLMFQLGGLGIMTCGAFFALAAGTSLGVREAATFRDLLESESVGDVRRLLATVLIFTLSAELIGACLISGLFSEYSFGEQIFQSVFHSVSAFCNAGFSLTPNSFVGYSTRWQVWGGVCGLIIAGGLGFAVVYNLSRAFAHEVTDIAKPPLFGIGGGRRRLTLNSKLVLVTTGGLLAGGMIGYWLLESIGTTPTESGAKRLADAWFQSVTFRTAGFNSVDHGDMQPATKLLAIGLMFIGAAPGSTGGGIKTACFAVAVLALISILRGREHVEIFGRRIPDRSIYRALAVISLGLCCVLVTTTMLIIFEKQPELFLNHLFEAMSAFATVGVSTGITGDLSAASQNVIIVTMFLGRVGPLTLMLALGRGHSKGHYRYPEERVLLG